MRMLSRHDVFDGIVRRQNAMEVSFHVQQSTARYLGLPTKLKNANAEVLNQS